MRFVVAAAVLSLGAASAADARPITFAAQPSGTGVLVLPLASAAELELRGGALDPVVRAAVARGLAAARFDYKAGASQSFRGLGGWEEILVLGAGSEPLTTTALQSLGGAAAAATAKAAGPVHFVASGLAPERDAAQAAVGAELGTYRFDRYKSPAPGQPVRSEAPFVVVTADPQAARAAWDRDGGALADAVAFTRDLITEPSNVLHPEAFVDRTRDAFRGVRGVTIEALDVPAMQRLGMGGILSVGQGSVRPPRLLLVEYRGSGARGAPVVLTGKGITFDSGGVSLKDASGMWRMKTDMSGAAAAVGAVLSLARSGAPVHVVGVAALAENMPDGGAARPGDVVKTYNGRTIERLNTDAEGRIVLADATAYAERRYKPAAIVNLATLTGAVRGALGDEYAGLFSRHDGLAVQVQAAGDRTEEAVWRLPLHPSYAKDLESPVADIRDVVEGGGAGAGIGAHFIGFFADPATPWAHLDIASVAWSDSGTPVAPAGARGWGVRLLDRFVRDFDPARVR